MFVAVPKSTTIAGAVCAPRLDGVGDAVRADLGRVGHGDLDAAHLGGAYDEGLLTQSVREGVAPHVRENGDDAGHRGRVNVCERYAVEREKRAQCGVELVRGVEAVCLEPPAPLHRAVLDKANRRLAVADVNCEKHGELQCSMVKP